MGRWHSAHYSWPSAPRCNKFVSCFGLMKICPSFLSKKGKKKEILTFETLIDLHKFQGAGSPMSLLSIDSNFQGVCSRQWPRYNFMSSLHMASDICFLWFVSNSHCYVPLNSHYLNFIPKTHTCKKKKEKNTVFQWRNWRAIANKHQSCINTVSLTI